MENERENEEQRAHGNKKCVKATKYVGVEKKLAKKSERKINQQSVCIVEETIMQGPRSARGQSRKGK